MQHINDARRRKHIITDALLKHWDNEGIAAASETYGTIRLTLDEAELGLSIHENAHGAMEIRIEGCLAPSTRRTWVDLPSRPLEEELSRIHAVVVRSFAFAAAKRKALAEREVAWRRAREEIERRQEEDRCWQRVLDMGRRFADATTVGQFLDAFEAELSRTGQVDGTAEFFDWARERLKGIHPLSDPAATFRRVTPAALVTGALADPGI